MRGEGHAPKPRQISAERLTGRPYTQSGAARRTNKLTPLSVPASVVCAGRDGVLRHDPEAHSGARGLLSMTALLCADQLASAELLSDPALSHFGSSAGPCLALWVRPGPSITRGQCISSWATQIAKERSAALPHTEYRRWRDFDVSGCRVTLVECLQAHRDLIDRKLDLPGVRAYY